MEHLIPRDLLQHDEEWNLTVSHRLCNENKLEALVGPHYIEKLFNRNENIIGSSHPWKGKIVTDKLKVSIKNLNTIKRPISWQERGLYFTPMSNGLRTAGTVEFAGLSSKKNQRVHHY